MTKATPLPDGRLRMNPIFATTGRTVGRGRTLFCAPPGFAGYARALAAVGWIAGLLLLSACQSAAGAEQEALADASPRAGAEATSRHTDQAPLGAQNAPTAGRNRTIGMSAGGLPIDLHEFGAGPRRVILVGGIHGGYEWNSILLAYRAIDYFAADASQVPENITLQIVASANPDGQKLVTGTSTRFREEDVAATTRPGRFNANGVDLNRNWGCNWRTDATWLNRSVSGGSEPFSEPETRALRDLFLAEPRPEAVIFWHSAAPGVFTGRCGEAEPGVSLGAVYGIASGYPYGKPFTSYVVTGDATDWLATLGIPALVVELTTQRSIEWERNRKALLAVLAHITEDP